MPKSNKVRRREFDLQATITQLESSDIVIKRNAVSTIVDLSGCDENKRRMTKAGVVDPLVRLLSDEDRIVRKDAALALACLAGNYKNKKSIAQAEAIEPLVRLLTDDDAEVKCQAARALGYLAENEEFQVGIVRAGAIAPLLELLAHSDIYVREYAAYALANLAENTEIKVSIAAVNAATSLVRVLTDTNAKVKKYSACALANLAANNQRPFVDAGAIVPLVELLGDRDADVKACAAFALMVLAHNDDNRGSIGEAGAIVPLVALLRDEDFKFKKHIAGALANLALNDDNQVLIAQAGAIDPLVQLFDQGDGNALMEAIIALTWLSQNFKNQQALLDRGILDRWQSLSSEISSWQPNEKIQYYLGLLTLSSDQEYKTLLLESGVLDELLAYLEGNVYPWSGLVVAKLLSRFVESNPQAYPLINTNQFAPVMDNLLARKDPGIGQLVEEILRMGGIPPEEVQRGEEIGSGASCSVYQGHFGARPVAIKCFKMTSPTADRRECIEREIRLMSRLRHRHLVHLFGIVRREDALPWLVMELAKQSLRDYLLENNSRDITWQLRLYWACELSDGLAYLHQNGVVHRDIKSFNVLVDDQLRVKWCDFGISREKEDVGVATQLETINSQEQGRQHPGTIRWMAPELLKPQRQADGSVRDLRQPSTKSDIWALGMVFFELIEGQLPWHEFVGAEIIAAIIDPDCKGEVVPTVCRKASPGFADIMQRCWKEREERPTAATIFQELTELDPPVEPSSPVRLGRGFSS